MNHSKSTLKTHRPNNRYGSVSSAGLRKETRNGRGRQLHRGILNHRGWLDYSSNSDNHLGQLTTKTQE